MTAVNTLRLFIDPPSFGAWNMAVDEALLLDAAYQGVATLRFYQWSEPTLSLGYFQRFADREQHAASRKCAIVRRPTGGGAILHDRELTYSVTLPAGHPFAGHTEKLYTAVHEAFIGALTPMLANHQFGWNLKRRDCDSTPKSGDEPFLCFQRRAPGDVVLSSSADNSGGNCKILGSAQRRHRGAVLQHGSLLLEKSPAAPELPGLNDVTGHALAADKITAAVSVHFSGHFGARLINSGLSFELELKSCELANNKYGSPTWTHRR